MYKSNELVMQRIYVTVVIVESDLACTIGVLRNGKVPCLICIYIHTYCSTYIHTTTPQVLRLHQP